MTEEDKKLLNIFEARLRHLMFLHDELKQENSRLKQLLDEKEESLNELEAKYAKLKAARMISIRDKDINDTRQRLSRLVREVDRCIALLNE